jgi:catechol 2,3-dioxygenase-like lactoylglutathione lyase family enzyme
MSSPKVKMQFHHIGLPTDDSQPGEAYVSDTKVWVTDPRRHPYKVEFLRFEKDSPVSGPVRDLPHIAFRVDDMAAALEGENVLIPPFSPSPGFHVAFVLQHGAVVEFMTFGSDDDLPWK